MRHVSPDWRSPAVCLVLPGVCVSLVAQLQAEKARLKELVRDSQENNLLLENAVKDLKVSVCWAPTVCCVNTVATLLAAGAMRTVLYMCAHVCALPAAHSCLLSFCRGCVLPSALQAELEAERSNTASAIADLQQQVKVVETALYHKQQVRAG